MLLWVSISLHPDSCENKEKAQASEKEEIHLTEEQTVVIPAMFAGKQKWLIYYILKINLLFFKFNVSQVNKDLRSNLKMLQNIYQT